MGEKSTNMALDAASWAMFETPHLVNPEDVLECKALFLEYRKDILKQCDHGGLLSILWRAREQALHGQTEQVSERLQRCRTLAPRKKIARPTPCAFCAHNTILVQNHAGETRMMTRQSQRALDNTRTVERFFRQTDLMLQFRLEELCRAAGAATHG